MEGTCVKKIWSGYSFSVCGNKAKVIEDGKLYCGVHDPQKKRDRERKWQEKYDAKTKQYNERMRAEAETRRKAACFDELLEIASRTVTFLDEFYEVSEQSFGGWGQLRDDARAAIAKAEEAEADESSQ